MSSSPSSFESSEDWAVEGIRGRKMKNGEVYYLLKWVGYPEEENTWEPLRNCLGAKHLIDEFEEQRSKRKSNRGRGSKKSVNVTSEKTPIQTTTAVSDIQKQLNFGESQPSTPSPSKTTHEKNYIKSPVKDVFVNTETDDSKILEMNKPLPRGKRPKIKPKPTIESILDKKYLHGELYYLVKRQNSAPEENTWEPFSECLEAVELIREFEDRDEENEIFQNCESIQDKRRGSRFETETTSSSKKTQNDELNQERFQNLRIEGTEFELGDINKISNNKNNTKFYHDKNSPESSSIKKCTEREIKIIGAQPAENGITIGISKNNSEEIFTFDSKEVFDLWPRLLVEYYESFIQFEN